MNTENSKENIALKKAATAYTISAGTRSDTMNAFIAGADWKNQNAADDTYDGYHTIGELYEYRKLYNAAFFNMLSLQNICPVVKSVKHSDGKECFDGGWFIVVAELPTGQISNHYEIKDWDLFKCKEVEIAPEWDGHTPQDAAKRLEEFCKLNYKIHHN